MIRVSWSDTVYKVNFGHFLKTSTKHVTSEAEKCNENVIEIRKKWCEPDW